MCNIEFRNIHSLNMDIYVFFESSPVMKTDDFDRPTDVTHVSFKYARMQIAKMYSLKFK